MLPHRRGACTEHTLALLSRDRKYGFLADVKRDQKSRAILYLRQSLDKTGEGLAIERQREACERLCRERGWDIIAVLDENDTSALRKRPKFNDLLARVERGEVDVIVCWHVDRLVRQLAQLEHIITICEQTGTKLATVSGDLDLSTDTGRLVGRILASVARGEVERKSVRQKAANRQRAQEGLPHAGGWRALGYEQDGVTLIPEEAEAIRDGFNLILAGGSLRAVGRDWTRRGLSATKEARGARPEWTWASIRQVLLNPRYAGIRAHDGEEFPAVWEPVVSEEVFRAVVAILTDPERRTAPAAGIGLLTGIAFCGVCGNTVNVSGGSRRRDEDDAPRRHRIYSCSGATTGRHITRQCGPIDELVTRLVIGRLSAVDAADLLVVHDSPGVPALIAERTSILERQRTLGADFADGSLPAATLRAATERLAQRLAELDESIAEAGKVSVLAPLVLADEVEEVWHGLDIDRQRAVIRELMTVRILPVGRGARIFRPESVRIAWKLDET